MLLIFSASITIFNISCNKESDAQQTNSKCLGLQPKFQFRINGSIKVCDALYNELIGWDRCPLIQYYDDGQTPWKMRGVYSRGSFSNQGISISGAKTAPTVGAILSSSVSGNIDNQEYVAGNITVNISSISKNRMSGTFSGNIRTTPNGNNVPITEGVFSNIPFGNFDWEIRQ